uniref:Mitochondrial calcium uniporter regulator 1 n=1 Tax=Accipiter nisus TaxID=211598 RepID=A0A8B9RQ36_9AVES
PPPPRAVASATGSARPRRRAPGRPLRPLTAAPGGAGASAGPAGRAAAAGSGVRAGAAKSPPLPSPDATPVVQRRGGAPRGEIGACEGCGAVRRGDCPQRLTRVDLEVRRLRRNVSISASSSLQSKGNISLLGNRKLFFDTHALVCLLEENGFTTQQSEVIVSALVKIMNTNLDMIYKDMVTKVQQEIALQQVMSHIGGVKKDMIILEKSEFSALRSENEKIKLELQQIKKQVMDEITKVRADNKLNLNLEKSRVKELYSLNERKLLEMRTEIVELHAQQDRALTQTDRKIDTEVADLKTMLESHKLDNIKYLAGSVFTCLTVALGFYRLWI